MSGSVYNILGGIIWWLFHYGKNNLTTETSEKYYFRNQITMFIFNLLVITSVILYFIYYS
jgi:hypothetical protein